METIDLGSWGEFDQALAQVESHRSRLGHEGVKASPPLFRGLGNYEWGLKTTLERAFPSELSVKVEDFATYYQNALAAKPTIETLTGEEWNGTFVSRYLESPERYAKLNLREFFGENLEVYRYCVYLRHHGYPSPLLDWTASPYIAAFFAFDGMDSLAQHVSVYAVLRDPLSTDSPTIPQVSVLGPYVRAHRRHIVQQCQYTICAVWDSDLKLCSHDDVLETPTTRFRAIRINIPSRERVTALRVLDLMNINPYSLYGSDESLIRTVSTRVGLFPRI